MNMRKFGFSSLALALGIFMGCGGDDGTGTGDGTTGDGTSSGGMTTAAMTTMSMTTTAMDGSSTGEPPATTGGMDDTSTGEPPADSTGSESGPGEESGSSSGTGGGGGGLNCEAPADECETCVCDMCDAQIEACDADPGCVAIRDCAAKNDCTGLDCIGPCGEVINENGGVGGMSAMLAGAIGACATKSCGGAGDPCAP